MKYRICKPHPEGTGNGDIAIKTDNGTLVALVYARARSEDFAETIVSALNSAFSPSMTDMMVPPEDLDAFLEANPLPNDPLNVAGE